MKLHLIVDVGATRAKSEDAIARRVSALEERVEPPFTTRLEALEQRIDALLGLEPKER